MRDILEIVVGIILAIIWIPLSFALMAGILALPFVAIGAGVAAGVRAFSWVMGWPT